MYFLFSFPKFAPRILREFLNETVKLLWIISEGEKMENKWWTDNVEIFKSDLLKIQAAELPSIVAGIIGYIILKVVCEHLMAEQWLLGISMDSLRETQGN